MFHIQTEDSGVKKPHIITHLFVEGGRILNSVKTSYAEFLEESELPKKVKALMQEQHKAMFIALRAGKFDHMFGDAPAAAAAPAAAPDSAKTESVPAAEHSLAGATAFAGAPAPGGAVAVSVSGAPASPQGFSEMRLPSLPSSLDLEAAAAAGLEIAGMSARAILSSSGVAPGRPVPEPEAAPPPSVRSPQEARAAAELGRAHTVTELKRPVTATKLEPPQARGNSVRPPPPGAPSESSRLRALANDPPMPRPRPAVPHRGPMSSSLELDLGTLERAAAERSKPVSQQVRDLPPPPAKVIRPNTPVNTGYRSITPQATRVTPARPSEPGARAPGPRKYTPSRPAAIFGNARPKEGLSIFGEDSISEKSLDEVILSYLAEDLDGPGSK